MRAIAAPGGLALSSFVLERNDSPYTKSVTYTAAAGAEWKKFEVPFTMAETYAANGYNLSFWVTYPNQEVEIGGFTILDYGSGVAFSQLGLSTWPYDEHAPDAPWRAAAAARIERYRKGDLAVIARDDTGQPIPGAAVHVRMNRHAFGFGTAVAGGSLSCDDKFVPPGPGSVITFFVTGDGAQTPAVSDGRMPAPPYPSPAAPWSVTIGGVDAPPCAARFAGLVYAGLTQVNVCIPDGVTRTAGVPIVFQSGAGISPLTTSIDLAPF